MHVHGRGAAHIATQAVHNSSALGGGLSRIPTDSLSLCGWTVFRCFDEPHISIVTEVNYMHLIDHADGLAGLTVQTHCLSGLAHYSLQHMQLLTQTVLARAISLAWVVNCDDGVISQSIGWGSNPRPCGY